VNHSPIGGGLPSPHTLEKIMPDGTHGWPASGESRREFPFALGHRRSLDGLRGVAILAVLLLHTSPPLASGGFIGVDIFFVLSGFLITSLLLQEHRRTGAISLSRFYLGRLLRLLPALLAVLGAVWVGTLLGGSEADIARLRDDSVSILLYVHNWRVANLPWKNMTLQLTPLWSLAIEEQFYLVWPAVLALMLALRVRRRWVVGFVLLAMLIPPILRAASWTGVESFQGVYFSTHTRADGLASGCMVALLASWWTSPATRWGHLVLRFGAWLSVGSLLIHVFATTVLDAYMYRGGFEVVNLSTAVLIVALLWSPPPLLTWILESRPLCWLGRVSYGTYLWNHVFFCLVYFGTVASIPPLLVPPSDLPPWIPPLLIWAGSLVFGALSLHVIERPFLLLKARLKRPMSSSSFTREAGPHGQGYRVAV
jgi:peptidoglycan/LPS O-acetylase OafA/YrhL